MPQPTWHRLAAGVPVIRGGTWLAPLLFLVALAAGCGPAGDAPPASPSDGTPPLVEGRAVEPGTYELTLYGTVEPLRIQLTLPAGWQGWAYGAFPTGEGAEPPAGTGISFWIVDDIYADPCRWDRGLLDPPPGASADALAAALKTQWGRYATLPASGELSGRSVIEMDLRVPSDIRFSGCAQEPGDRTGYFLYWPQRGGGGRYAQGPDQREHLWILQIGDARLVVDASYFPATSAADRNELWDIATSVQVS
jgi:hypothetical protein